MFFFLPLGTDRPRWRTPYVTYGLLLACALTFWVQSQAPGWLPDGFVPAHPSLLAWLASLFMHGGLLHLAGNMLFLWLFGTIAEDVLGPGLFLLFYLGGAVGATGLDTLMSGAASAQDLNVARVGASGAIAGIMGLAAVCFIRTKVRIWYLVGFFLTWRTGTFQVTAPVFVGLWVSWEVLQGLLQSALGAAGGVAHWAHVGGFIVGLAGSVALGLHKRVPRSDLVSGRVPVEDAFGGYAQAGELQKLVIESPQDADAWYALGRSYELALRAQKAKEAYERALLLFLQQRRPQEAAKAYDGMREYGLPTGLTADQQFDLACALEEAGKAREAYGLFRQTAIHHPEGERAETALIRAGEIARSSLGDAQRAEECYRRLVEHYPYSNWRGLAQDRLRELAVAEKGAGGGEQARPSGEGEADLPRRDG